MSNANNTATPQDEEIKVGDTVEVTACLYKHEFPIGKTVIVVRIDQYSDVDSYGIYDCSDGFQMWLLCSDEFKKV